MLRVRLDCCEERDGVVHFDGAPLSGIGVEVGSESVMQGRPVGVITLWRYHDGVRTGAWVEPWFGDDPSTILHDAGDFYSTDGMGSIIFNKSRLDGLIAAFEPGGFLRMLTLYSDGDPLPKSIAWRNDGNVYALSDFVVAEAGENAYRVMVHAGWGDHDGGPSTEMGATETGSTIERGVVQSVPRLEPQFEGDDFSPVRFTRATTKPPYSEFLIALDDSRLISRLRLNDPGHFDLLAEIGEEPPAFSWRVRSLDELAGFDLGPALEVDARTTAEGLDMLVESLGGFAALAPVGKLVLHSYQLRSEQVEALLELPNLIEVEVTENERFGEQNRGIRQLCQALKRRRPDVQVTLDNSFVESET